MSKTKKENKKEQLSSQGFNHGRDMARDQANQSITGVTGGLGTITPPVTGATHAQERAMGCSVHPTRYSFASRTLL